MSGSKLESLDRLRDEIKHHLIGCEQTWYALADEIEREIERDFMRLPVDADGVPIHVGDELCGYGHPGGGVQVAMVSESCVIVREDLNHNPAKHGLLWVANETRHVKPDKLKERVMEWLDSWGCSYDFDGVDRAADELCADIREMAKDGDL